MNQKSHHPHSTNWKRCSQKKAYFCRKKVTCEYAFKISYCDKYCHIVQYSIWARMSTMSHVVLNCSISTYSESSLWTEIFGILYIVFYFGWDCTVSQIILKIDPVIFLKTSENRINATAFVFVSGPICALFSTFSRNLIFFKWNTLYIFSSNFSIFFLRTLWNSMNFDSNQKNPYKYLSFSWIHQT